MPEDLIVAGCGLQGGLLALAVLHHRPRARVLVIEREASLVQEATWSHHALDVPEEERVWFEPLVAHHWPGYQVRFPGLERTVHQPYVTVTAGRFARVVRERIEAAERARFVSGTPVRRLAAGFVETGDGERYEGRTVIDARGPAPDPPPAGAGFQKFVGLEVRLERDADLRLPVVMDATVEQRGGFRFFYLLPFAPGRLLAEDTCFSSRPVLDREALRAGVLAYLEDRGLQPAEILREEAGVLPMPWTAPEPQPGEEVITAGVRGGWFHPATGYALPASVRLAGRIARKLNDPGLPAALASYRRRHERQARFARLLNRMLFRVIPPARRWTIFRRFHRLPEETISRFYALETTFTDRARILLDHPPGLSFLRLPRSK